MGRNQEVGGQCLEHRNKLVCVMGRGLGGQAKDNAWSRGESWW